MKLDTGREALNTQIASNTVAITGRYLQYPTTAPSASAVTVNLTEGEIVTAPVVAHRLADEDVDAGALASNKACAYIVGEYYNPAIGAFVVLVLAGSVIDYTGTETPTLPTLDEFEAAVASALSSTDDVDVDKYAIAGGLLAYNDGTTVTLEADDSVRPFGVTNDMKLTSASERRTLTVSGSQSDPGDAGAVVFSGPETFVALVSGGAETRTLADPEYLGQRLSLCMDTDAGDIVITAASGVNQAGNTSLTFADAGDHLALEAITVAGAPKWRILANDGVALA